MRTYLQGVDLGFGGKPHMHIGATHEWVYTPEADGNKQCNPMVVKMDRSINSHWW